MKAQWIGMLSLLLLTAPAMAAGTPVATCSNGEEVNLTLTRNAKGLYDASVTVQSVGDSYPEFHYNNLQLVPHAPGLMGAPQIYRGKGIELTIQFDASTAPADLDIPAIGLNHEKLNCR